MTIQIVTIPCLSDNYAFLIHNPETNETALADAPESCPIERELDDRGWSLDTILLTHHHDDHIDGVADLVSKYGCKVIGATQDKHRLPRLDIEVQPGDHIEVCGQNVDIWDVSGHTVGHIAFIMKSQNAVFTGDSLMALGCGRLFEGTPEMMCNSLSQFLDLPDEVIVCSGHEYTSKNAEFALSIDPDNADLQARAAEIAKMRGEGIPTVPSNLGIEKKTNPFLRAANPELKNAVGMETAQDSEVFAKIRGLRDVF